MSLIRNSVSNEINGLASNDFYGGVQTQHVVVRPLVNLRLSTTCEAPPRPPGVRSLTCMYACVRLHVTDVDAPAEKAAWLLTAFNVVCTISQHINAPNDRTKVLLAFSLRPSFLLIVFVCACGNGPPPPWIAYAYWEYPNGCTIRWPTLRYDQTSSCARD